MSSKLFGLIIRSSFAKSKPVFDTGYVASLKTDCSRRLLPIVPFKLADFGEGIREVTIKAILVKVGDYVNQFDEVCRVESDKASISVTSRYDGVIKKIHHDVGDVVLIGSTIIDIETSNSDEESTLSSPNEKDDDNVDNKNDDNKHVDNNAYADDNKTLTTPAVRRIAMENKIDIGDVRGTGKAGRILKEDLLRYLEKERTTIVDNDEKIHGDKRKLSLPIGYRKTMAKTMTLSNEIPTMVLADEFDLTKLVEIKEKSKNRNFHNDEKSDNAYSKITLLPFLVKAVSLSLRRYPLLNATYENDEIILRTSHNICLAIDTPSGLVAPNVKNVQNLTIRRISDELTRLRKRALDDSLTLDDLADGTFALSNIGSIAGTVVKPLIIPPQIVIGAIGRLRLLPRFDTDGNLIKSNVTVISWAADHRVIDGATLGRFSNAVKSYLENPELFLIES